MRLAALLALAALGCSRAYRPDVTEISGGRFVIRSAPDDEQRSEEIAVEYAYRRAGEVCPDGYEELERKNGTAATTERIAVFGRRTLEFPEVTITVRCRTRERRNRS